MYKIGKLGVQKLKGGALKAAFVEIRLTLYWLHSEEHLVSNLSFLAAYARNESFPPICLYWGTAAATRGQHATVTVCDG